MQTRSNPTQSPLSKQQDKSKSPTKTTDQTVSPNIHAHPGLGLQRNLGNHGMQRLLKARIIQAKLRMGSTNDVYEQEADRVAARIMRMPDKVLQKSVSTAPPKKTIQRQADDETEEVFIQTKPVGGMPSPPTFEGGVRTIQGAGAPLSASTRSFFEPRFGADFSQVRVHTDRKAASLAGQVQAKAFTLGRDLVFASGQYSPETTEGKHLLAHELTHVVQQQSAGSAGIVQRQPVYISRHGSQPYLQSANQFFQQWSSGPIQTGVDSIEEIVADLAQQPSIGHVTIVSHAHPTQLYLAMLNGGSSGILESEWLIGDISANPLQFDETQEQENNPLTRRRTETGRISEQLFRLERHLTTRADLAAAKSGLRQNQPELVGRIGNLNDSITEQYIWWNVELRFINTANFTRSQKRRLRTAIRQRLAAYRQTLVLASALSGAEIASEDFDALDRAIPEVLNEANYSWPNLSRRGGRRSQRRNAFNQLQNSASVPLNRVLRNPEFIDNLWTVKQRMSSSSWIEIQGCRLGSQPGQLRNIRTFFAGQQAPRVSAPDWFQAFGQISWDEVRNDNRTIARRWNRRSVRAAFNYWFPIISAQEIPDGGLTREHFKTYLGAGNVLPVGRRLLVRQDLRQEAIIAWLSRHQYDLNQAPEIERQFFTAGFRQGMRNTVIDYLQERRDARSPVAFRPDPAYQQHIISEP